MRRSPFSKHVAVAAAMVFAFAVNLSRADTPVVPTAAAGTPVRVTGDQARQKLAIKGIFIKPTNLKIGVVRAGLFCTGDEEVRFSDKVAGPVMQSAGRITRTELEGAGYTVPEESAFDATGLGADVEYQIAATLVDLKIDVCMSNRTFEGGVWLQINWELYSPRERRIVYRAVQAGSHLTKDKMALGDMFEMAVRSAVRNLLADPAFVTEATQRARGTVAKDVEVLAITTRFSGGGASQARIAELQSSVVTVYSGIGSGSGFFISPAGYLLTNQHVVGDAKFVKIKLASGRELLGEVLRTAAERDVALVKTEPVALAPIAVSGGEASAGDEVYALGSPFGEPLAQSVTRGVVSGVRTIDNVRWLQSDVTIAPGSSGGPLVNAAGGAIGLARSGVPGVNVNFFVPIVDAMSSLKITFHQP